MPIPGYIREQPETVARCLAAVARPWPRPGVRGLALVGAGSSRNAVGMTAPAFRRRLRAPVLELEPPELEDALADGAVEGFAAIVLSQGGGSVGTVAAALAARQAGLPTLLVTAEARSALAALGPPLHLMPVGEEPVGPKTKGFLGSVATLLALAGEGGGFDAARLAAALAPARAAAEALAAELDDPDALLFAGHGAARGLALEASLKIAEMAGVPSAAFGWEEAMHGRLHGLTPRSLLVALADTGARRAEGARAAVAMAARGCRLFVAAPGDPGWDPAGLPGGFTWFGPALVLQWLAVRLAERRGLRPEAMRHGNLSADLAIKIRPEP